VVGDEVRFKCYAVGESDPVLRFGRYD
jgi:hypothetical protein